jgi:hypothetical protein
MSFWEPIAMEGSVNPHIYDNACDYYGNSEHRHKPSHSSEAVVEPCIDEI